MKTTMPKLRRAIRKVLLESTGSMTIGQVASQYPELWEAFCDVGNYELKGYKEGSPLMDQPVGDFLRSERYSTDDKYWWADYLGTHSQKAQIALEVLANDVGWTYLSYSGLDFEACYEATVEACERFDVPPPTHLEDKAWDMNGDQDIDSSLGSDWMSKFRDKFDM